MEDTNSYNITNIDLGDTEYTVEQSLIRNKYEITDSQGNLVLKGKQKMLKLKEEFPFVDSEGEEVFRIKANKISDIGGSYNLTDSETDDVIVVIDEDFSIFVETWTIRDPESGDPLAIIESENKILSALRELNEMANLVPNKYTISRPDGTVVGRIKGEFSLKDKYTVHIDRNADIPREAVMATSCVLDALENN